MVHMTGSENSITHPHIHHLVAARTRSIAWRCQLDHLFGGTEETIVWPTSNNQWESWSKDSWKWRLGVKIDHGSQACVCVCMHVRLGYVCNTTTKLIAISWQACAPVHLIGRREFSSHHKFTFSMTSVQLICLRMFTRYENDFLKMEKVAVVQLLIACISIFTLSPSFNCSFLIFTCTEAMILVRSLRLRNCFHVAAAWSSGRRLILEIDSQLSECLALVTTKAIWSLKTVSHYPIKPKLWVVHSGTYGKEKCIPYLIYPTCRHRCNRLTISAYLHLLSVPWKSMVIRLATVSIPRNLFADSVQITHTSYFGSTKTFDDLGWKRLLL